MQDALRPVWLECVFPAGSLQQAPGVPSEINGGIRGGAPGVDDGFDRADSLTHQGSQTNGEGLVHRVGDRRVLRAVHHPHQLDPHEKIGGQRPIVARGVQPRDRGR